MRMLFTHNWKMLLARGILAVVFGLLALIWPRISLIVLMLLFAAYVFVDGVITLVTGFRGRGIDRRWLLAVLEGAAGVLIGILTVLWPEITAMVLLVLIALWAVVTGVLEIAAGVQASRATAGGWLLLAGGVLSVIIGILLLAYPAGGALAVVWLIGLYALVFGVLLCVLAYHIRRTEQL